MKLEQLKLQSGSPSCSMQPTLSSSVRPREVQLPKMGENANPLAFFSCWKKTLKLNGVDEALYMKSHPAHLNERAKQVFAGLSYEQGLNFDLVKSHIVSSFRASASDYLDKFRTMKRTRKPKDVCDKTQWSLWLLHASCRSNVIWPTKTRSYRRTIFGYPAYPATRQFVCNNKRKDAQEAASYADLWFENTTRVRNSAVTNINKQFKKAMKQIQNCEQTRRQNCLSHLTSSPLTNQLHSSRKMRVLFAMTKITSKLAVPIG